jgi:diaminohydroxyphosphoribosylaminopyrimidine deaminase / 5-amino-6-(5-phosphoribosylamino)uracil reductase
VTEPAASSHGPNLHDTAWELVRSLRIRHASNGASANGAAFELNVAGTLVRFDPQRGAVQGCEALPPNTAQMLELCLPLCAPHGTNAFVYAHLGQSLDGQIATASGASQYVTSTENLQHMHRLRALADAIVVGAGTVERDDPRLTTRLVPGENPVRVVIDPSLRLPAERHVFRDGQAKTLIVCRAGRPRPARFEPAVELVEIDSSAPELPPRAIVEALQKRGLRRLFVEGGGVTVSRFLAARALHRLHVAVCPLFIGRGRPGVVLPGVDRMEQTLRPSARRFLLGEDVLFDCAFEPVADV